MISILSLRAAGMENTATDEIPDTDDFGNELSESEQSEVTPELENRFHAAAARLAAIAQSQTQDDLLFFYARYKLASDGPPNKSQAPSLFSRPAVRRKYAAWAALAAMPRAVAMQQYVLKLCHLDPSFKASLTHSASSSARHGLGAGVSRPVAEKEQGEEKEKNDVFWAVKRLSTAEWSEWWSSSGEKEGLVLERDKDGLTALHWAADGGKEEVVKSLLSAGADVNAQDSEGLTPLHYAVDCSQMGVARALLHAGADPTVTDRDGNLPLSAALLLQLKRSHDPTPTEDQFSL